MNYFWFQWIYVFKKKSRERFFFKFNNVVKVFDNRSPCGTSSGQVKGTVPMIECSGGPVLVL